MSIMAYPVNNILKSIPSTNNVSELISKGVEARNNFLSLFQSDGKEVGDIVQGFEVIADEGLGTKKDTLSPIVGKLTENGSINLKSASSRKSDISTITGQSVVDGFLHSTVSSVNTIGINNTLSSLTSDTIGINKIIKSIAGDNVLNSILDAVSPEGIAKDFVTEFTNISETSGNLTSVISSAFSDVEIFDTVTGNTKIKEVLQRRFSNRFISSEKDTNNITVNSTGTFNGASTPDDYQFTYVNTIEELMLEFRNSTRDFSQIIVEFTGEYVDDNFDAKDFQTLYSNTNGFDGIPYHYIVRKDGRIQRGRPLDIETVYVGGDISYSKSIVIAIPGGYDVPEGTERAKKSVNSSTTSSWYWFNTLLDVAYTMFPGIQVYASTELSNTGWSADAYIESLFGKRNNKQPSSSAVTRSILVSTEPE